MTPIYSMNFLNKQNWKQTPFHLPGSSILHATRGYQTCARARVFEGVLLAHVFLNFTVASPDVKSIPPVLKNKKFTFTIPEF